MLHVEKVSSAPASPTGSWVPVTEIYANGDPIEQVQYDSKIIWGDVPGGWKKTESFSQTSTLCSTGNITHTYSGSSNSFRNQLQGPSSITVSNPFPFSIRVTLSASYNGTDATGSSPTSQLSGSRGTVRKTIAASDSASFAATEFGSSFFGVVSRDVSHNVGFLYVSFTLQWSATGVGNSTYSGITLSGTTMSWTNTSTGNGTTTLPGQSWSCTASATKTVDAAAPYIKITNPSYSSSNPPFDLRKTTAMSTTPSGRLFGDQNPTVGNSTVFTVAWNLSGQTVTSTLKMRLTISYSFHLLLSNTGQNNIGTSTATGSVSKDVTISGDTGSTTVTMGTTTLSSLGQSGTSVASVRIDSFRVSLSASLISGGIQGASFTSWSGSLFSYSYSGSPVIYMNLEMASSPYYYQRSVPYGSMAGVSSYTRTLTFNAPAASTVKNIYVPG